MTETSASPAINVKKSAGEEINFFGKPDINKHGNIGSHMPAWYHNSQKDELEINISRSESAIARGEVEVDQRPRHQEELRQMKDKLERINEYTPKLVGPQEDFINKINISLGQKISMSMFTRNEMNKGLVDAHEEARRMADPCIKLDKDEMIAASRCNFRVDKSGMVSRTDAERLWKMGRRALGENSNTEILRRQQ